MTVAGGLGGNVGAGGGVLQPANHIAVRQVAKRVLLQIFGIANRLLEICMSNGVMLNKPSKPWEAFCHCTVWFEQTLIES
jgi:hypothetical protein